MRTPPRFRLKDTRLAWICWCVFAAAITLNTLAKRDVVTLNDAAGTRIVGRLVERSPAAVSIIPRGEIEPTRIDASNITQVSPLGERSVTGNYRYGAERLRSARPMYDDGVHGFLYLPQAALLFLPFEVLPPWLGEVLWRWLGIGLYALGVHTLSKRLFPMAVPAAFTIASALAIPGALGSAQNGQTNLMMGGLFALSAVHAGEHRWGRVALWSMLALACKPVALAVIGLFGACRPRAIPAMAIGAFVFLAAPFLHPDPGFVWAQHAGALAKIAAAADPASGGTGSYFTELRGMLRDFGWELSDRSLLPARVLAALGALALALWVSRRGRSPTFPGDAGKQRAGLAPALDEPRRMFLLVLLGVAYIMIFSPRTEGVTYALIAPLAAILATHAIFAQRWPAALLLIAYCLILQFSIPITNLITGPGYKYWLRPLATVVLVTGVSGALLLGRDRMQSGREG